jgi:hypothetical protein
MEICICGTTINVDWCGQIAFKGEPSEISALVQSVESYEIRRSVSEDNTVILAGLEPNRMLELLKQYKSLKACAFLDQFQPAKVRATYIGYSEEGQCDFSKQYYLGICDGQSDFSFSDEVDILQSKMKIYSSVLTSCGERVRISYAFPFTDKWYGSDYIPEDEEYPQESDENNVFENGVLEIYDDEIPEKAYEGRTDIYEVQLSDEVQWIHNEAFKGCKNLRGINFPGIIEGGSEEEGICTGWNEYDYFLYIGADILKDTQIETVHYDKEKGTFYYMGCLLKATCEELRIRDDTLYVAWGALQGVKKLIVPPFGEDNDVNVGEWMNSKYSHCIEEVIIENGVEGIREWCFDEDMVNLRKIVIPESVTEIDEYAFLMEDEDKEKITLYVKKGSVAEKFAKKNGFKYEMN